MPTWSIPRARPAAALAVACAALFALAPGSAAIVPPSDCGLLVVEGKRYNIKADQLRCKTARTYARQYLSMHRAPRAYRCRDFTAKDTKLKFRCTHRAQVFFAIRR